MPPSIRRIVAGVATPRPDDPALAAGLRLSARLGAELHLLHVEAPGEAPHHPPPGWAGALRDLAESADPAPGSRPVVCRVASGPPDQRLLEAAAEAGADLLLMGATRRGPLAGAVLGTTAGHVLRGARVPILVVREPLPERPLRVLLTTDLSRHSAHAHAHGGALARALAGAPEPEMRTLFVEPPTLSDDAPPPPRQAGDVERELADFLAAEQPPGTSTPRVRSGAPAAETLREAREWGADLLVLGTHGRRGALRLFLGSVAETVLRHAPCATLVVPPVRAGQAGAEATAA